MCYILGTVFVITSGLIYTLQRAVSALVWNGEINAKFDGGIPQPPGPLEPFTNNIFVPIFLLVGIILFVHGKKLKPGFGLASDNEHYEK